jgi:hypothetical protein
MLMSCREGTVFKYTLIFVAAVIIAACNSAPSQTTDNTVGGANVVGYTQAPMVKQTTTLALDWGKKAQAGQAAIADVISFGGPAPAITAPAGWQMIRDDSTATTRQSLYWHAVAANDPSTATWTFSAPVDAQGAMVLLDNVAAGAPVDMSTGNTGTGGTVTAKSMMTTANADLIISFYATDFHLPGLAPQLPTDVNTVMNEETTPDEFWILTAYQQQFGATEDEVGTAVQLFNWVAAQVSIKHGTTSP